MKKIITIAIAIIMVLTLFIGCGTKAPAAESTSAPASQASSTAPKDAKLVVLEDSLAAEEYGIAFKKGNTQVHDAVMSTIDEMIADGTAAKISEKWFGKDIVVKGEAIKKAKLPEGKTKFVMGLDDAFPPMGFRNESNEIVGFDIDLAKEVCKRLGVEFVAQPIDWNSKELELDKGSIDCIWNGLSITPERQEKMLISRPYLANKQVIVVNDASGIKSKADLEGKKVAVQTGSSGEEALSKDEISKKVAETVQMTDYVTALQDLKTGRIDAVVVDEIVARYYIANN